MRKCAPGRENDMCEVTEVYNHSLVSSEKKQSEPQGQSKGHGGDHKERALGALRNQNLILNIIGSYLTEFNEEKDIIRFLTQYVQNLTPQISSPNSLPMGSQSQNSDSFSTVRTSH